MPELKALLEQADGGNEKGVLLLAKTQIETQEQELKLLEKILGAVQLDLKKDTLLLHGTPNNPISFTQVFRNQPIRYAFSFGYSPAELGLHLRVPKYHPLKFREVWLCFSDPLYELIDNKSNKAALWQALQQVF
ncbi:MAG: hypothetical protein KDC44_22325 [Phaeodactylibacter sp.]|nr:hypothetical protein [Phaeodactylibacter sp.]